MDNLYVLTTCNLGQFYVIESDPTAAEALLLDTLHKGNYGTERDREVVIISKTTNGLTQSPHNPLTPFFAFKGNRLLIADQWNSERIKALLLKFATWHYNLPGDISIDAKLVEDFLLHLKTEQ